MLVIAVTGGIASGKSTVAKIFHDKFDIPVIDTDQIARDIVAPGCDLLDKIANKFGSEILEQDKNNQNKLDRTKLRQIIFNNPEAKKWLENLLHPEINKQTRLQVQKLADRNKYPYCLVLIPLLTKQYLANNDFINKTIVVESTNENKISRASSRDNQSIQNIEKIINTQLSDIQRRELADYVIDNNSSITELEKQIYKLHKDLIIL